MIKEYDFKRVKALLLIGILAILLAAVSPKTVYAESATFDEIQKELQLNIDSQLEMIDLKGLDEYLQGLNNENYDGKIIDKIREILDSSTDKQDYMSTILDIILQGFYAVLPSLIIIVVVASLLGIIIRNKSGGVVNSTNQTLYFVCYSVIIISVLASVYQLILSTSKTIENVAKLTNLSLPILLTLMAALGGNASLSVYQPAVAVLSGGIITVVSQVILPLITYSAVFSVISNISENIRLNKLTRFFQNVSNTILGIVFTVFTAFLTVRGISGAVSDSVSIRTVKFATRNYIPILGGYIADSVDLILASSVMIKNSLGVVTLILLLITVFAPVAQILVYSFGLQLVSAVIEPITDKRIVSFLSDISRSLTVLIVCILAVAFMLFMLIMLVICTANLV